jgi:hypothetical protein
MQRVVGDAEHEHSHEAVVHTHDPASPTEGGR